MLSSLTGSEDPKTFRETDLYRKCLEIGIIPESEADLEIRQAGRSEMHRGPGTGAEQTIDPVGPHEAGYLDLTLTVDGMWCPACAWVIDTALAKAPGISEAACHFSTDKLSCRYDPVVTSPAQIVQTVNGLGYRASLDESGYDAREKKKELIRLILSAALTLNIMMLSFALYTGFLSWFAEADIRLLSWPIFAMASIVLIYGGGHIFRKAWTGIMHGAYGMETLISIGAGSAFFYSTVGLINGSLHIYFDTAAMLITLVLLGKMIEDNAKRDVQADLARFQSLLPTKVRICTESLPKGRYVSIRQLQINDRFRVETSEALAADGEVLDGDGYVDESSVSGEARPIHKQKGDLLSSGTQVTQGAFTVKALRIGRESSLGQMIQIMEETLSGRTQLEEKTDRILRWFVPGILLLAVSAALVCTINGASSETAFIRAITVLVIACPCALGIAIPMAKVAGISLSGRNGLLVRDFSAFDRSADIDTFVFDKTGTLTRGKWQLLETLVVGPYSAEKVHSIALALEQKSNHPIAAALRRRGTGIPLHPLDLERIEPFENGISAPTEEGLAKIGSEAFLASELAASASLLNATSADAVRDASRVYMSISGKICAVFCFGDEIKPDAASTVARLQESGIHVSIVSGDSMEATLRIARLVGCDTASGSMLPKDKIDWVKALQEKGSRVAMVGDGINDAPALAQADLSIAVHAGIGSRLTEQTADITLMGGAPGQVFLFTALASLVNRKIKQNLIWAFLYNVISLPVAMMGFLTPVIAVSAMLLSSISVIANTLRLSRYEIAHS